MRAVGEPSFSRPEHTSGVDFLWPQVDLEKGVMNVWEGKEVQGIIRLMLYVIKIE